MAKLDLLVARGCNINAAELIALLLTDNTPRAVDSLLKVGARTEIKNCELDSSTFGA